jgi:excisionase family DNA binding protein
MAKEKEQEKEYLTLQEASEYSGIKRATIYNYLNDLNIQTLKVGRDRRAYISLADAKRLKEYKETPWKVKVETRKSKSEAA